MSPTPLSSHRKNQWGFVDHFCTNEAIDYHHHIYALNTILSRSGGSYRLTDSTLKAFRPPRNVSLGLLRSSLPRWAADREGGNRVMFVVEHILRVGLIYNYDSKKHRADRKTRTITQDKPEVIEPTKKVRLLYYPKDVSGFDEDGVIDLARTFCSRPAACFSARRPGAAATHSHKRSEATIHPINVFSHANVTSLCLYCMVALSSCIDWGPCPQFIPLDVAPFFKSPRPHSPPG